MVGQTLAYSTFNQVKVEVDITLKIIKQVVPSVVLLEVPPVGSIFTTLRRGNNKK